MGTRPSSNNCSLGLPKNGCILSDRNIQNAFISPLVLHLHNGMEILVQVLLRRTLILEVESPDMTDSVKAKIREREEYPPHQQLLTLAGEQIEDKHTLSDYDVQNKSSLLITFSLEERQG